MPGDRAAAGASRLAAVLAAEHARAAAARAGFTRAWKRFAGKRTERHLDAVRERLSERASPGGRPRTAAASET
jgi:hypothetical protein